MKARRGFLIGEFSNRGNGSLAFGKCQRVFVERCPIVWLKNPNAVLANFELGRLLLIFYRQFRDVIFFVHQFNFNSRNLRSDLNLPGWSIKQNCNPKPDPRQARGNTNQGHQVFENLRTGGWGSDGWYRFGAGRLVCQATGRIGRVHAKEFAK